MKPIYFLLGLAVIAATIAFSTRYQVTGSFVLDQWTGHVSYCYAGGRCTP